MKYIDADRLRAEIEKVYKSVIQPWLSGVSATSAIYDYVLPLIDSLQQEQPEVDLEREIDRAWEYLEKDYSPSALDKSVIIVSGLVGEKQFSRIARHFYELGFNARKEE